MLVLVTHGQKKKVLRSLGLLQDLLQTLPGANVLCHTTVVLLRSTTLMKLALADAQRSTNNHEDIQIQWNLSALRMGRTNLGSPTGCPKCSNLASVSAAQPHIQGIFSFSPEPHIAFCPIFVHPLFPGFEPHVQKWVTSSPFDLPNCQTVIVVRVCVTASLAFGGRRFHTNTLTHLWGFSKKARWRSKAGGRRAMFSGGLGVQGWGFGRFREIRGFRKV